MENTLENKAKFFAQYWGQMVLSDGQEIGGCAGDCEPDMFLQLKALSLITDEDIREVATIALFDPSIEDWSADEVWTGEGDMDSFSNHSVECGMRCWTGVLSINDQTGSISLHDDEGEAQEIYNLSDVFDRLREKGYALRWNGLSVEQLEEYGWIKLQEA